MGKLDARHRLTVVRRLWGQHSIGPRGVLLQSIARTTFPISPPPTSQATGPVCSGNNLDTSVPAALWGLRLLGRLRDERVPAETKESVFCKPIPRAVAFVLFIQIRSKRLLYRRPSRMPDHALLTCANGQRCIHLSLAPVLLEAGEVEAAQLGQ